MGERKRETEREREKERERENMTFPSYNGEKFKPIKKNETGLFGKKTT